MPGPNVRVYSSHFLSEKPAMLYCETNSKSLKMGTWCKKERKRTEKVTLLTLYYSNFNTFWFFWWRSNLTSSKMILGIVSILRKRQRWLLAMTSPPPCSALRCSPHWVPYAQWFICGRNDSHKQQYLRSIHTTTIVTTGRVWFHYY